jgi:hypothetical protein
MKLGAVISTSLGETDNLEKAQLSYAHTIYCYLRLNGAQVVTSLVPKSARVA